MATKILKLTNMEDIIGDYEERDGKHFIKKFQKTSSLVGEDE